MFFNSERSVGALGIVIDSYFAKRNAVYRFPREMKNCHLSSLLKLASFSRKKPVNYKRVLKLEEI